MSTRIPLYLSPSISLDHQLQPVYTALPRIVTSDRDWSQQLVRSARCWVSMCLVPLYCRWPRRIFQFPNDVSTNPPCRETDAFPLRYRDADGSLKQVTWNSSEWSADLGVCFMTRSKLNDIDLFTLLNLADRQYRFVEVVFVNLFELFSVDWYSNKGEQFLSRSPWSGRKSIDVFQIWEEKGRSQCDVNALLIFFFHQQISIDGEESILSKTQKWILTNTHLSSIDSKFLRDHLFLPTVNGPSTIGVHSSLRLSNWNSYFSVSWVIILFCSDRNLFCLFVVAEIPLLNRWEVENFDKRKERFWISWRCKRRHSWCYLRIKILPISFSSNQSDRWLSSLAFWAGAL